MRDAQLGASGLTFGGLLFFTLLGHGHPGSPYVHAYALALPACAVLLLAAAVLVHRPPVTPYEAQNALIERLPDGPPGLATRCSWPQTAGSAIGCSQTSSPGPAKRRLRRTEQAPEDPGEFFAYHVDAASEDSAWLSYLEREALAYGAGPIPHEPQRLPVIQAQVEDLLDGHQEPPAGDPAPHAQAAIDGGRR
jgi:hypothetical protein